MNQSEESSPKSIMKEKFLSRISDMVSNQGKNTKMMTEENYTNIIRKLKLLNDKSPGYHLKLYSKNDYILPKHHEILTVVNTVDYISNNNNHQETLTMVNNGPKI